MPYCGTSFSWFARNHHRAGSWAVSASVVTPCLMGVQRSVSSASYKQGAFFTEGTMESVRESIACSRGFMASSAFDPWEGISRTDRTEFVTRHTVAFDHYLARKKKKAEEGLRDAHRSPRYVRFSTGSSSSTSGSGDLPRTTFLPKSSSDFASTVALSKVCGSSGSSRKGTKSPDTSLSVLLNQGKTDERAEKILRGHYGGMEGSLVKGVAGGRILERVSLPDSRNDSN